MPILNKLVAWRMKKRFHQMELFIKYPHEVQDEVLQRLVSSASNTVYGKRYGFDKIKSYEDFKRAVPLCSYEEIEEDILKVKEGAQNLFWPSEIKWFAKSSGTTSSKSKFIPVSEEALEDCHYKGGKDMLSIYCNHNPSTRIYSGKTLLLGGSKQINQISNESYYGDLSAILISNLPFWVSIKRTPDMETMLMEEWEEKLELMSEQTIQQNITNISGVPSWTLVLFHKILEKTGAENIHEIWPNLELFLHGGVSFDPYRAQFEKLLPKNGMSYLETYNASEGFFGIQYQPEVNDLLLMLDYGIFYEFIPMSEFGQPDAKVISIKDVEVGVNYAMVVSTNAGLWRYVLGDTVRFTSVNPYCFKISGRTKHFINAFGEELIVQNADKAIQKAGNSCGILISDYTAAPVYFSDKQSGAHEWIIEINEEPSDKNKFIRELDECLKANNSDYEAKRHKNLVLAQPVVHFVPNGTFNRWLASKGKMGGQNKVPRLSNDRSFLKEILNIL